MYIYYNKYLKYKNKYLALKYGGSSNNNLLIDDLINELYKVTAIIDKTDNSFVLLNNEFAFKIILSGPNDDLSPTFTSCGNNSGESLQRVSAKPRHIISKHNLLNEVNIMKIVGEVNYTPKLINHFQFNQQDIQNIIQKTESTLLDYDNEDEDKIRINSCIYEILNFLNLALDDSEIANHVQILQTENIITKGFISQNNLEGMDKEDSIQYFDKAMQKMMEIGYQDYDKSWDPAGNSPDYFFNPETKQVYFIDFGSWNKITN